MTDINVIAHRGANHYAPQNTNEAFEKAVEVGCDGFETDVHLTKDGVPVICHNFTIDATSNGKGYIRDLTLDELRSYDFGSYRGEQFAGIKIPTLDEFLDVSASMGDKMKVLDIELKSEHFGDSGTEIAEKTIAAVKEHDLFDKLLISSFDPALLVVCKKIDPKCKTGILYSPEKWVSVKVSMHPVSFCKEIRADALHPHYAYVNKLYVKRAHDAGLEVNPWTVDRERTAKRLIELGVDGLITNDPFLMNNLLGKESVEPAMYDCRKQ